MHCLPLHVLMPPFPASWCIFATPSVHRAIRNKPVVNRDPVAAAIAQLRSQLAATRAENASLKRRLGEVEGGGAALPGGGAGEERLQAALVEMQARVQGLERDNRRLKVELDGARGDAAHATQRMVAAQAAAARLQQRLAAVDPVAAEEEAAAAGGEPGSGADVVEAQLLHIAELEQEVCSGSGGWPGLDQGCSGIRVPGSYLLPCTYPRCHPRSSA